MALNPVARTESLRPNNHCTRTTKHPRSLRRASVTGLAPLALRSLHSGRIVALGATCLFGVSS